MTYIKIFGYQESCGKMPSQICEELSRIRPEIQNRLENAGTALLLEDDVKKPRFSFYTPGRVCAAFIHDSSAAASKWVYSHEYGRHILENFTDGQVRTLSYENVRTDGEVDQAVEDAVRRGANVIFTTTPKLLLSSVRQAALHPDVKILNCSPEHLLPLGAHLLPPAVRGQVYQGGHCRHSDPGRLHRLCSRLPYLRQHRQHQCLRPGSPNGERQRPHLSGLGPSPGRRRGGTSPGPGIVYIDYLDRLAASTGTQMGNRHNLALIQTHWGRLYQSLVRRVMEGSWKQEDQGSSAVNYWWGMEQGVVSVLCSRRLPTGPRRLAGVLRRP